MISPFATSLHFSDIESEILGLKVSRCNSDFFDEKELYKQIIENRYDLCRLKVPAEDEYAPKRLQQTGLPCFFSGSIRKYRTRIADNPDINYLHPNLTYEVYDGSQDQLLKDMLVNTWGNYPLGYYRSPYLSELVTKEQELECVFRYYKKYNLNKDYPNNQILFMKDGTQYIGIFTLNLVGNTLECNLAGILEPYRKDGYFLDEMNFKKEYCLKHNIEYFTFGARNENAAVQRLFQFLGFETAGNDNVFQIPSLLTYSKTPVVIKEINTADLDTKNVYQQLFNEALQLGLNRMPEKCKISFQLNNEHRLLNKSKPCRIRFSFPVVSAGQLLIVIQSEDSGFEAFTGYFSASLPA